MSHPAQVKIPATYMRGGTSKGVFFRLQDLPPAAQAKLLTHSQARESLGGLSRLINDEESGII